MANSLLGSWLHLRANVRLFLLHAVPVACILLTAASTQAQSSTGALSIAISDGREVASPGDALTYTIVIRNEREGVRQVDVRMLIPDHTNLISASHNGRHEGAFVVWDDIAVSGESMRTLTVYAEVNPYAPLDITLEAQVEAEGKRGIDLTTVSDRGAASALVITVTDNRETAEPKELLTYRIRVRNSGGSDRTFTLHATIPNEMTFETATGDGRIRNGTLEWPRKTLKAGDDQEYVVTGRVDRSVPGFYALRMQAYVSGTHEKAVDVTTVHIGPLKEDFDVAVDADRDAALPGEEITYRVTVRNDSALLATEVNVSVALPIYTEFVSASHSGLFHGGSEVRWAGLTISPHGSRVLQLVAVVRRDAPRGAELQSTVLVNGHRSVNSVLVQQGKAHRDERTSENVFLRKTADRSEVRPGDTVTYAISIRNTTGKTLHGVEVNDRFDARTMTLVAFDQEASVTGDGLSWRVAELQPGEEWLRRYTVRVASDVPQGLILPNIVSVGGPDVAFLSLTERVETARISVMTSLPPTGAPLDQVFLGFTGLLGAGQAFCFRRKTISPTS